MGREDRSGPPFTTASPGKTVLDKAQPQFIGTYAGPASPPGTWDFMSAADYILALGTNITDDYLNVMASSSGATGRPADTVGALRAILTEVVKMTDGLVLVDVIIPEKDLVAQLERLVATSVIVRKASCRDG